MGQSERRAAAVRDLARAGVRDMHVQIVEYDPCWPAAFEAERQRLAPLLAGVEIHHVGSTAVPGLAAKPIIDMIACVERYEEPIKRLVTEATYQYPQAFNATLTKRRFLLYPTPRCAPTICIWSTIARSWSATWPSVRTSALTQNWPLSMPSSSGRSPPAFHLTARPIPRPRRSSSEASSGPANAELRPAVQGWWQLCAALWDLRIGLVGVGSMASRPPAYC